MPHPHLIIENGPAGSRWLRLSRPERRNALDVSLTLAVRDALAADPSVPVLLGSADPQVFCAGADLTISDAERAAVSDLIYDCCETIITRPGPVIAVLTGRWVEAPEALNLGISEMLGVSGIKLVMTAGGLLDRLQAERAASQSAWARAIGPELSAVEDR
jgi:hypothetical protein